MYLYIVRHGKAEDAGDYVRDEDRPLTARGFEQAKYLARQVSAGVHPPELILSSGYSRAVATARVIHQSVRCRFELAPSLECGHAASAAIDLIERHAAVSRIGERMAEGMTDRRAARTHVPTALMLVGHNPQVGELCTILAQGLSGSEMMLRTGEAVCLEVKPGDLIGTGRFIERLRLDDVCVGR